MASPAGAGGPATPAFADSIAEYQTCIRDLLGLLALPSVWRSRDPQAILTSVLEVFDSVLPIALACGRIRSDTGPIDVARVTGRRIAPDDPEWTTMCAPLSNPGMTTLEVGFGLLHLSHIPLGLHGARGRLVVGSLRAEFPTLAQSVLLRTAGSLADSAMETASLLEQLRHERGSLERRVDERTRDLTRSERDRERLLHRIVDAQELERRRISRDLHDHVGQQLTALRLGLDAAGREEPSAARATILKLQQVAKHLDVEVDGLAWELRPTALDDLGLGSTLEAFVGQWSSQFTIEARYHQSGADARWPSHIETHILRIAQEALNNVAKHASARRVTVILERGESDLALIVEDDGAGFDPDAQSRGLGVVSMRERAALIGGTLQIESVAGKGTTLFLRVAAPAGAADE